MGEILDLAERYCQDGADELVFYDITASPEGRSVDRQWITDVARLLDIPFCVAGGIRTLDDAEEILRRGADKISINSPALERPELITELATRFGSQCVVLGVDSRWVGTSWQVYQYTGDVTTTIDTQRNTVDWIAEAQDRGVGEVVLNCMNSDGVREGYDIEQLNHVQRHCQVPLVASGGAGSEKHFRDVFEKTSVSAALAASVFHKGEIRIGDLKTYLDKSGIEVRT